MRLLGLFERAFCRIGWAAVAILAAVVWCFAAPLTLAFRMTLDLVMFAGAMPAVHRWRMSLEDLLDAMFLVVVLVMERAAVGEFFGRHQRFWRRNSNQETFARHHAMLV